MRALDVFAIIGLSAGLLGLAVVIYPVLVTMIREARSGHTHEKTIALLLPIAKGTYLLLMLPVLGYSLYTTLTPPADPESRLLIRGLYGFGVFINGIAWLLIYTHIVQRSVQWFKKHTKGGL